MFVQLVIGADLMPSLQVYDDTLSSNMKGQRAIVNSLVFLNVDDTVACWACPTIVAINGRVL
jgi:hypothetical protein